MSNDVFPALAGITWPVIRAPMFSTIIQTGSDLSELRGTFAPQPVYDFTLTYDILRSDSHAEFQTLCGFFENHGGSFDSFLFTDVSDANVSNQVFGTGNGVATVFQLIRGMGSSNVAVKNIANAAVTINNSPVANFTTSNGVLTFTPAPAANDVLRWTGSYYFRCRFGEDSQEFEQFMRLFWQVGQIKLRGALGLQI